MTPKQLMAVSVSPALALLPEYMDSPEARRLLVAIATQESYVDGIYRRLQIRGPARSRFQVESGGALHGVMTHHATRGHLQDVVRLLDLPWDGYQLGEAMAYSAALAGAVARLNLWWLPRPLPVDVNDGWDQYLATWRAGAYTRGDEEHRRALRRRWGTLAWPAGEEAITT